MVWQALEMLDTLPARSTMVGLVCDGGEKYLDSVFDDDWMKTRDLPDDDVESRVENMLAGFANTELETT